MLNFQHFANLKQYFLFIFVFRSLVKPGIKASQERIPDSSGKI